jgi:hypothetical protein
VPEIQQKGTFKKHRVEGSIQGRCGRVQQLPGNVANWRARAVMTTCLEKNGQKRGQADTLA